jgi:hypothetical protein
MGEWLMTGVFSAGLHCHQPEDRFWPGLAWGGKSKKQVQGASPRVVVGRWLCATWVQAVTLACFLHTLASICRAFLMANS